MIDKTLTIGVEIEMTGISRMDAAKMVAQTLGTPDLPINRTDTSLYDRKLVKDRTGRTWTIERDGSIMTEADRNGRNGGVNSVELVTPILHYEDIETLQKVVRALRGAGARVNASCGIHIHIGADAFDGRSLRNLVNIMASKQSLIYKALGTYLNRATRYCRPVDPHFLEALNRDKPEDVDGIKALWYRLVDHGDGVWFQKDRYNQTRYHALNLHAINIHHTIEFRLFNGTLHAGKIKAYIQFCLAVSSQAIHQKSASPKETETTNPKYTFRTWLLRMGLIGDEFKTCRKWMLDNLSGDIAFRHGREGARRSA